MGVTGFTSERSCNRCTFELKCVRCGIITFVSYFSCIMFSFINNCSVKIEGLSLYSKELNYEAMKLFRK